MSESIGSTTASFTTNAKPKIVTLCGSTRFHQAFAEWNSIFTLQGYIVLSIGCNMKTDDQLFGHLLEDEKAKIKARLDELHLRKIDLSDLIFVINQGGYIGESTQREIEYAGAKGLPIHYAEPPGALPFDDGHL